MREERSMWIGDGRKEGCGEEIGGGRKEVERKWEWRDPRMREERQM